MILMYVAAVFVLGFIGAGVAIASRENIPMKLIAIALAAPAMFTTAGGGAKAPGASLLGIVYEFIMPISTAYAADKSLQPSTISDGVKLFFGVGKDESRYHVIVGSFANRGQATPLLEKLHKFA